MEGGTGLLITAREVPRELTAARQHDELLRTLASVVEYSAEFIGVCSLDLTPIFVNDAGRRMVGLGERDIRQTHVLDYFWPADRARIEAEAVPALRREGRWCGEVRFRNFSTGEPVHTMWNAFTIRDDAGVPVAYATISPNRDSLERAEAALRESEARFRSLVEPWAQAVWETAPDGLVVKDSPSWRAYTGQTLEQCLGNGWLDAFHPDDRERAARGWRKAVAARRPLDAELRLRHVGGDWRWTNVRAAPLVGPDGTTRCWIGMNVDITERKEAERVLREADQRKSNFLAMLAHELRNPLASIRNASFLLDRAPPGAPQSVRAREVIRRQSAHLAKLVDDLLDVTRVSHGKVVLKREAVDVRELARRARDDLRATFEQRGIELRYEEPEKAVVASCDPTRMMQVIGNLLHNAAKFTLRGGTTTMAVTEVGGKAEIRVRDTGVGIRPDQVDGLFTAFAQGDSVFTREHGGLGLGLAVVRGMMELHGGRAWGRG
jgi:PAS domain S-box-containing protein